MSILPKVLAIILLCGLTVTGLTAQRAIAGEADVVDVRVTPEAGGTFRFDVTVRHTDEGWDHYADGWEILGPSAILLGKRKLWHPHVDEQPFTRSLTGVEIPVEIGQVKIRAHDSVHGYGGREVIIRVPR